MALKTDRRLATVVAQFGAMPAVAFICAPIWLRCHLLEHRHAHVMFQLVVILFDRIAAKRPARPQNPASSQMPSQTLAGNWP